jgi:hypothetical protein
VSHEIVVNLNASVKVTDEQMATVNATLPSSMVSGTYTIKPRPTAAQTASRVNEKNLVG